MTGVSPSGSGSRASHEAASASSPEASIPNADLPTVVSEGVMKLGEIEITVLQLSNGQRVIEEASMNALLSAIFDGEQSERTEA